MVNVFVEREINVQVLQNMGKLLTNLKANILTKMLLDEVP